MSTDKKKIEEGLKKIIKDSEYWIWNGFNQRQATDWDVLSKNLLSFIETLLAQEREERYNKIKEFDKRLDFYNEHTVKEHTIGEQMIVQNIQSDFMNIFGEELAKIKQSK